ncbi:MAG TPA: inositol monophosphatase family protein [Lacipirellulaceae bacterium]|nr:inositol monophosphatase family protein [Lacipirellulaceae bacterium]
MSIQISESKNGISIDMSDEEGNEWLATCEAAARAGGEQIRAWRGRFRTREKGRSDLVTDADLASQDAIRSVIAARFPDHSFVGEEQSTTPLSRRASDLQWLVDPLDGTTNYVHGYPHFAVSVALLRGGDILAGVIYDPTRDQCFAAAAGRGAWCDGMRLQTSRVTEVSESLVAVSLPAHVRRNSPDLLDFIEAVQTCQAVRRSGSAALNLAHVASGALDAFWATHIHAWDVAAGVLLVREAGGIITGRDGASFDLWNPHFLAASGPQLHHNLLDVLTTFAGPDRSLSGK